eukprot:CAMPEP_0117672402 /NCGR_PEP_ID=MMETSP0804-20121206/13886_1 /TAXON_ID=1074897 /ORGANISM="Tetraselmis astigmatica, Strain CCMP880" /LENGTH=89 /DNA_ID=CAMNT_0005481003 /DNA_START=185 /DNA_END=454 /DNA_ORIENTATION=+
MSPSKLKTSHTDMTRASDTGDIPLASPTNGAVGELLCYDGPAPSAAATSPGSLPVVAETEDFSLCYGQATALPIKCSTSTGNLLCWEAQ